MGNRVKGKVKKKSIKAAISSSAGSKRKLSRMGKKQKREHRGLEASFIGRSKCLKLLQVTLKDFRRLCILKGIYPREPQGRFPGNKKGQTFYHIKDIRAIAHEPILQKFRDFRAFMKKVRRAAGRNELDEAARKNALMPTYTLHHLVKERYPRFVDALSDLDDGLTLSYLFASLPSSGDIKASVVIKAKNLVASWGAYCATTYCITRSFISVKGVYMEAVICGATVRWIVPHAFTQYVPTDVDYRVMMTFLEFYETLLNFVMFRLYSDIGLRYPLSQSDFGSNVVVGSTSKILASHLTLLRRALDVKTSGGSIGNILSDIMKQQKKLTPSQSLSEKSPTSVTGDGAKTDTRQKAVRNALQTLDDKPLDEDDDSDKVASVSGPLQAALQTMTEESDRTTITGQDLDDKVIERKRLFAGLTFFLSREIPRGYLDLVILAFGGKVGWEGDDVNSSVLVTDPSITHHVVDRPQLPSSYDGFPKSREFIQPQWIVDSANFMFRLPVAKYAVGATLPPHLSPFVDNAEEGYVPAYAEEIERLINGEEITEEVAVDSSYTLLSKKTIPMESNGKEFCDDPDKSDDASQYSDEDDVSMTEESNNEKKTTLQLSTKKVSRAEAENDEAHALAKSMMNRKAAHLYGRMMHGKAKKQAKVDLLQKRREEIQGREKNSAGKSALKQKVERLKQERKTIEDTYSQPEGSMKKKHRHSSL